MLSKNYRQPANICLSPHRVFLEFTSLVYKAMKLEEKRKKGRAKTQELRDANAVVPHHQMSQDFAATTYQSPRAVAAPPTRPPRPWAVPPPGGVNPVWARLGLLG